MSDVDLRRSGSARDRALALADLLERTEAEVAASCAELEAGQMRVLGQLELLHRDLLRRTAPIGAGELPPAAVPAAPVPAPGADLGDHPAVLDAERLVREADRARRRSAPPVAPKRDAARVERQVAFVLSLAGFLGLGWLAARLTGELPGDAVSRVQAAQAVLFGRDPHLAALGFIWGPFPALFQVPLVWLRQWWLPMTGDAIAAVIVSALFMAGVVTQLLRWGEESGARTLMRIAVVVVTVAHPLIWLFGANGMSEACWLFFLLVAVRRLALWSETDDLRHLALVGASLGVAYLVRYETAAILVAVAAYVGVVTFRRWHPRIDDPAFGEPRWEHDRERLQRTMLDVVLVALPGLACIAMWAFASWAIVGEPFPQFTSEYGNSALVRAAAPSLGGLVPDYTPIGRAWFYLAQVGIAATGVVVLTLLAVGSSRVRTSRPVAALVVFGSPLAVQLLFSFQGSTFPWFRYTIAGVVLVALLALSLGPAGVGLQAVAVALAIPGVLLTASLTSDGSWGHIDVGNTMPALAAAFRGESAKEDSDIGVGRRIATEVDGLAGAVPGSVLCDTAGCWAIVANAPHPDLFVIPPDRDYAPLVADPQEFGVRYLLVPNPDRGTFDSVRAEHPDIWDDGGNVGEIVKEWGTEDQPRTNWRLYRVTDPRGEPPATPDEELVG